MTASDTPSGIQTPGLSSHFLEPAALSDPSQDAGHFIVLERPDVPANLLD